VSDKKVNGGGVVLIVFFIFSLVIFSEFNSFLFALKKSKVKDWFSIASFVFLERNL